MTAAQTNPPLTPPSRGTGQSVSLPSWEGLGGGFMVPMRSNFQRSLSLNRCWKRGQPCPRETMARNSRTRLSAILSVAGSCCGTHHTASLMLCPASAHAQGSSLFHATSK